MSVTVRPVSLAALLLREEAPPWKTLGGDSHLIADLLGFLCVFRFLTARILGRERKERSMGEGRGERERGRVHILRINCCSIQALKLGWKQRKANIN